MRLLAALASGLAWSGSLAEAKAVFAHFIVSHISLLVRPWVLANDTGRRAGGKHQIPWLG